MRIRDRKQRVVDLYHNPFLMPLSLFEAKHLSSVRDFKRNDYSENINAPIKECVDIQEFKDADNIVLYSGGKESFLTSKILTHFDIPHKKLFIQEIGTIRDSEKHSIYNEISEEIKSSCDFIYPSRILHNTIRSNQFGRNFMITYYYILEALEMYPGCNLFVGAEWLSEHFYHSQIKYEHSDYLYNDINTDTDIIGNVFSILNSLLEFDAYRLAVNYFGYDDRWSYYDHKKKEERIGYFRRMNELINDISNYSNKEDLLSELEFIVPEYRLMPPYLYDFRRDISSFLRHYENR